MEKNDSVAAVEAAMDFSGKTGKGLLAAAAAVTRVVVRLNDADENFWKLVESGRSDARLNKTLCLDIPNGECTRTSFL